MPNLLSTNSCVIFGNGLRLDVGQHLLHHRVPAA
jgi:hypothetical protein